MPLKDVQTGYNTFDWTLLDARIEEIAARGHQAVFSTYLDYPDQVYGVPDFLAHVPKQSYTDNGNGTHATSYSPDYSNADLQQAILNYIAALGARYDDDPRVAFVGAGLLGFWGEWHTYPYDWGPTPAFMNQVLDAYASAFPNKFIIAREPKPGVDTDRARLGFGDGSFAYETLGPTGWHFWPKIINAGQQNVWQTRPIGGELRPEVQNCIWDDTSCALAGQEFAPSVATTHVSWLVNHGVFVNNLGAMQLQRAATAAQSMGYSLHISKASLDEVKVGQALRGTVTIENRGVAPFYYPWTVNLAALDAQGHLLTWPMAWDVRTVVQGSPITWTFDIAAPGLAAGTYTLLVGVPNPMTGGKPLKFADASQDQHRAGWLSLGTYVVQP